MGLGSSYPSQFELSGFYFMYDLRQVGYNLTSFLKSEQKIICWVPFMILEWQLNYHDF